ncbi:hypothetical protein M422DRAFT_260376 [Sphaerobolus stellatus SS14]|uniref:Uncharacterized protein n=1 Tax=Sphaerobolus stellatus (strain SS14) TaxID=990650 RepID=A0A0C9U2X6_SPHS4|nr:hypothetical protein M422DRAFT_260376 [Sphaerobolus stellatus SS14]
MSASSGAALCAVSPGLFDLASPLLYHNVILRDPQAFFSFKTTLNSSPQGPLYSTSVRELYLPKQLIYQTFPLPTDHLSLLNLQSLSVYRLSHLRPFQAGLFEEISHVLTLESLTHLTLPPRAFLGGLSLHPRIMPNLTHIALPINLGNEKIGIILDKYRFVNRTYLEYSLKKIVLVSCNISKRERISELTDRRTFLEMFKLDVEDQRYVVASNDLSHFMSVKPQGV